MNRPSMASSGFEPVRFTFLTFFSSLSLFVSAALLCAKDKKEVEEVEEEEDETEDEPEIRA